MTTTSLIPNEVLRILAERRGATLTDKEHATIAECSPMRSTLARELKACREALKAILDIEDGKGEGAGIGGLSDDLTYYDCPCQTAGLSAAIAAARACLPRDAT